MTPTQRLIAKIQEDPYYRETYRAFGTVEACVAAGFFDDGIEAPCPNEDLSRVLTPFDKVKKRLGDRQGKAIILHTTGSFAPMYQGHLDMMETAREYFESQGRLVAGGYLSLSHDNYVTIKAPGTDTYTVEVRRALAEQAVSDSPWLTIDTSEALYNPGDRNCTAVFTRLKKYLSFHFGSETFEYYYMYGSDLAYFSGAFIGTGEDICVCRNETVEEVRRKLAPGNKTLVLENIRGSGHYSSTKIRSEATSRGT